MEQERMRKCVNCGNPATNSALIHGKRVPLCADWSCEEAVAENPPEGCKCDSCRWEKAFGASKTAGTLREWPYGAEVATVEPKEGLLT